PLLLLAGACFWNLGVLLGVCGILLGDSTGYQWLEFPGYAAIILFVAYTLVVSWAVLMFRYRRGEQIYITQWYLLGAFLWFPWLYAAGQLMLFVVPVQGVLQSAVGWWYANNLLFLWFGAIALGTAYYMIPKVIGRPVYSYHLATIGFWSYALFSMVIFGSMYYIVPRLIGREWRYASLIKLHFWASAYGIGLMTLMLLAGGFLQGSSMEDPSLTFSESVETVLPYLRGRSLAG